MRWGCAGAGRGRAGGEEIRLQLREPVLCAVSRGILAEGPAPRAHSVLLRLHLPRGKLVFLSRSLCFETPIFHPIMVLPQVMNQVLQQVLPRLKSFYNALTKKEVCRCLNAPAQIERPVSVRTSHHMRTYFRTETGSTGQRQVLGLGLGQAAR